MKAKDGSEREKASRANVEPPPKERVELMFEQMLGEVRAIGEGQVATHKAVVELREEMDRRFKEHKAETDFATRMLSREIGILSKGQEELKGDVAGLKTDVAGLKGDVGRLDDKIDAVARDLKEHRADTTAHLALH